MSVSRTSLAALTAALAIPLALGATLASPQPAAAAGLDGVKLNEIDSQPSDWVELVNSSSSAIDLTGVELRDNSDDHRWRFAAGTTIPAGGYLVADDTTAGLVPDGAGWKSGTFSSAIGLGGGDSVRLYAADGTLSDSYTWQAHAALNGDAAAATYGRLPDGGAWAITTPTPGAANRAPVAAVAINEVESNAENDGPDWVEVINTGSSPVDISGWTVMDNDPDKHAMDVTPLSAGTTLQPGAVRVFTEKVDFDFGLGKDDSATLRDASGATVDSYSWTAHATTTYGRCPDGTGAFTTTLSATPGALNACTEVTPTEPVETSPWPGPATTTVIDQQPTFLEDSSGLDYVSNGDGTGVLWGIDNGTGRIFKLDVAADGTVTSDAAWGDGKRVRFPHDAGNPDAKGPDTEGISVGGDGFLYAASERDNSAKGVNRNSILRIDPAGTGPDLVAVKEWDITSLLPNVAANTGIEAVEWVPAGTVAGTFTDEATSAPFDPAVYGAAAVYFVAFEDNGHVYAFILGEDGSATRIGDFTTGLSGAMALDYDSTAGALWVACDDGCDGTLAQLRFTAGQAAPQVSHIARPSGLPNTNNEGFATTDQCIDGVRAVFWFTDGVRPGALQRGGLDCESTPVTTDPAGTPGTGETTAAATDAAAPTTPTAAGSSLASTGAGDLMPLGLLGLALAAAGLLLARRREGQR